MKEFDLFQEQPSLPLEEAAKNEVPDGEPPLLAQEDAPEEEAASPEEESCPEEAAFDQGQGAEEPPCPPECPAGPSLQEVLEAQKQLLQKVEELQALFQSRILHTDHEEKIVDQMHHELQKHREGSMPSWCAPSCWMSSRCGTASGAWPLSIWKARGPAGYPQQDFCRVCPGFAGYFGAQRSGGL